DHKRRQSAEKPDDAARLARRCKLAVRVRLTAMRYDRKDLTWAATFRCRPQKLFDLTVACDLRACFSIRHPAITSSPSAQSRPRGGRAARHGAEMKKAAGPTPAPAAYPGKLNI